MIDGDTLADDLERLSELRPMTNAELTLALVSALRRISTLDANLRRSIEELTALAGSVVTMQNTMRDMTDLMRQVVAAHGAKVPGNSGGGNPGPKLVS